MYSYKMFLYKMFPYYFHSPNSLSQFNTNYKLSREHLSLSRMLGNVAWLTHLIWMYNIMVFISL